MRWKWNVCDCVSLSLVTWTSQSSPSPSGLTTYTVSVLIIRAELARGATGAETSKKKIPHQARNSTKWWVFQKTETGRAESGDLHPTEKLQVYQGHVIEAIAYSLWMEQWKLVKITAYSFASLYTDVAPLHFLHRICKQRCFIIGRHFLLRRQIFIRRFFLINILNCVECVCCANNARYLPVR